MYSYTMYTHAHMHTAHTQSRILAGSVSVSSLNTLSLLLPFLHIAGSTPLLEVTEVKDDCWSEFLYAIMSVVHEQSRLGKITDA